jgi:hypothetical protein
VRAAAAKADAEATASRSRAQADADAARAREADAAARAKSDAKTTLRDEEPRVAKAEQAPASAAAIGPRYDGAWNVTVVCEPQPGGASGYKFDFVAQVKDNFLHGERRLEGSPGWLKLQGPIRPDGSATLDAQGLTDDPKYAGKNVAQGTPYAYHVAAHFDSDHGSGRRLEMRACDLHFAKR